MKIYMAGPLFSTAELAFNKELADLLRKQGHEVFLPQEHEQRKDLPGAIFESVVYRTDFRLFEGSDPINLMMTESADHVIIMPMASVADLAAEIGRLLDALSNGTR
jgi:nucleoside 2-deoxyribosyltransferase